LVGEDPLGEDPLGYCVFGQGVKHGIAIHKAFSLYWEMVSEKHFFDVEECFLHLSDGQVFACGQNVRTIVMLS
jgi:hypothetical protein